MVQTYTLKQAEALTLARKLTEAWGEAYYQAALNGRDLAQVEVDGEGRERYGERIDGLVAPAWGQTQANAFAFIAAAFLDAQADLGQAYRRAEARETYTAGIAVGRAEACVAFATDKLRQASKPHLTISQSLLYIE